MTSDNPPTRSESLHLQVARNIRNKITAGVLRDGDVLASTREMAEQWDVSVFTITEAMKVLAGEGLIVSKSRSKRTVNYPDGERREHLRLDRPSAVLVGGFPGSGKTELGRILARLTGWPILDKDTLTRPVVESALEILGQSPNDRESSAYLDKIRPREYEALMAAGVENVMCGNSAILTAPYIREFRDEAWISRTQAQFTAMNVSTVFVWLYCDADSMHRYMRQRGAARDASKLADWSSYLASVDLELRPPVPHYVLDNSTSSEPLQMQAQELVKKISGRTS